MRRARRTTRSRSCSGSAIRAGRSIDRLARTGNDRAYDFPVTAADARGSECAAATGDGVLPADIARRIDFSFSGLKTAVLRLVRERTGAEQGGKAGAAGEAARSPPQEIADICASFQRAVVDALLDRTFEAARWLDARSVGNRRRRLRQQPACAPTPRRAAIRDGIPVFIPPIVALDRQCGDDRRRRAAPVPSAGPGAGTSMRRRGWHCE